MTDEINQYEDVILWIYDEQYIRKCKLNKLNNQDVNLPTHIKGKVLFEMNKIRSLFFCDYDYIWDLLYINYSPSHIKCQMFITNILSKKINLSGYKVGDDLLISLNQLRDKGYDFKLIK